jgi:hypothetical protein
VSKERSGLIDKYEKFNWLTMGVSLLIIGGSIGLALATIDAAQIAAIRLYKKRKKRTSDDK